MDTKIIPFDLSRIHEEGVRVITRNKRAVRVLRSDSDDARPITAMIASADNDEVFIHTFDYFIDGMRYLDESEFDLLLEVPIQYRRMTHQELSWWLRDHPEEHREWMRGDGLRVWSVFEYSLARASDPCDPNTMIRSNGGEWRDPLIEI